MAEALIQILKDTQTDPAQQKIIYPQTVGQAVYLDINNKKINLQTAIDSELIGPSGGELRVSSIVIDKKTTLVLVIFSLFYILLKFQLMIGKV